MITECPFCGENRKQFLTKNGYDTNTMYFVETPAFSISPDLSPLCVGHLLIIPTDHFSCYGEFNTPDIDEQIHLMTKQLLGTDDILYFEHGAVIEGVGGASIDHAHLHAFPRNDISEEILDMHILETGDVSGQKIRGDISSLHNLYLSNQPYIFYEISHQKYAYKVENLPHQFLRKVIAGIFSIRYDWRKYYSSVESREMVNKTIKLINANS